MFSTYSFGQISPGDLAQAHAHLEGMSNCTQCHDLGDKVPDSKCLACHTEIDNLIKNYKGYHVSAEVTEKNCVQCHNDHHGRKFKLIRFEEEGFDHDLTGYTLEGSHFTVDCRKCHTPENIIDPEIRKRENTYLGLDDKCLSCHEDFHQKTLDNDCLSCHNMDAFRPAPKFDHDEAAFALVGAHKDVECKKCHPMTVQNGEDFQEFTGLEFNDCKSCHDDPHNGNLPGKCANCHTEKSFDSFAGQKRFDHRSTAFELRGSHRDVKCFDCHSHEPLPAIIFQDKKDIQENNCVACHDDVHDGKFGQNCAKCHTEDSFLNLKNKSDFDHSVTDYPLEGMHVGVDCKDCHKTKFTDPIDFSQCKNCHEDYHRGELADNGVSPDCQECHIVDQPFTYTLYGVKKHQEASFPLDGAHLATPCFACHISEDRWSFRNIGNTCIDCHEDVHEGFISARYYTGEDCTVCHTTEAWNQVTFDHDVTDWPLTGKHQEASCRSCHIKDDALKSEFSQQFEGLSTDCISCHDNVHGDQFAIDGVTDCTRCHEANDWEPVNFDHSTTNFPLDGKHAEVECKECHPKERNADGEWKVIYKTGKLECIDCHT